MIKPFRVTKTGLTDIKTELQDLLKRRLLVADKLKTAREFGDLSENAEYHTAREEQVQIESRVSELEQIIKDVKIIEKPLPNGEIQLGSTVVLVSEEDNSKRELKLVGSVEANPESSKISDESPIGQALMGKKIGELVEIKAPAGSILYKIKEIK